MAVLCWWGWGREGLGEEGGRGELRGACHRMACCVRHGREMKGPKWAKLIMTILRRRVRARQVEYECEDQVEGYAPPCFAMLEIRIEVYPRRYQALPPLRSRAFIR